MAIDRNHVSNVPNLRFPEFEGEWVAVQFGEIATFLKGKGISKDELSDAGMPCVLYGELYTKYKDEIINTVFSKTSIDARELVTSLSNDVLIPSSGESAIEISTARCITKDGVLLGGDLNIVRLHKDNGSFISYQLNGKRKNDIGKIAQGSSVVHLYNESLKKLKVWLPHKKEQNKIALTLALINKRIATQRKIISQLETLMKSLRDKVFSQQLRFPAITEEWKKYRVSDLLEFYSTNSLSWEQLEYKGGTLRNLHYGLIHQGLPMLIDAASSALPNIKAESLPAHYTLCKNGDIAFADASEDTNDVAKAVEFIDCRGKNIVCGLHTIHARDKLNATINGFKGFAFQAPAFRQQIQRLAQGTKVFSISPRILGQCFIYIPAKQEQQKIFSLLSGIEQKINTESNLLRAYESQRGYFLQNLFI